LCLSACCLVLVLVLGFFSAVICFVLLSFVCAVFLHIYTFFLYLVYFFLLIYFRVNVSSLLFFVAVVVFLSW
jgi:hypothetical protein